MEWQLAFYLSTDADGERDMLVCNFLIFSLYLTIPTRLLVKQSSMGEEPRYGFYIYTRLIANFESIVWCWKYKTIHWDMPWTYTWESTSILSLDPPNQSMVIHKKTSSGMEDWNYRQEIIKQYSMTLPYSYILKSGERQDVKATIYHEQMVWKMRALPFIKKVRNSIDIQFSSEVGEKAGSWKGGCTGCGYELKGNESPLECLRRMELERKF